MMRQVIRGLEYGERRRRVTYEQCRLPPSEIMRRRRIAPPRPAAVVRGREELTLTHLNHYSFSCGRGGKVKMAGGGAN